MPILSSHRGSRAVLGLFLAGLLAMAAPSAAPADEGQDSGKSGTSKAEEKRPVIDAAQVYYGAPATCKAPAVVDADRVYRAIPEYKKILDNKLTEKDPNYSMLLLRASRKFKKAVESGATDKAADLVANLGAVTWEGHTVPDITDTVLEKLEEAEKAAK